MRFGVPFDVAFSAEPHWRLAALVVLGQIEGQEWSWQELRWLPQQT